MRTIFSTATAGVPPREALDHWQDVGRVVSNHRSKFIDPLNFSAEMRTGKLDDVLIVAWQSSSGVAHTSDTEDLILILPSSRARYQIGDRCFEVDRNNLYLLDVRGRTEAVTRSLEPVDRVAARIPPGFCSDASLSTTE